MAMLGHLQSLVVPTSWAVPRFAGQIVRPHGGREAPAHAAPEAQKTLRQGFLDIAPFLLDSGEAAKTKAPTRKRTNAFGGGSGMCYLYNANIIPLFDNSYSSDVTTKSSITMGKCASKFQASNFAGTLEHLPESHSGTMSPRGS